MQSPGFCLDEARPDLAADEYVGCVKFKACAYRALTGPRWHATAKKGSESTLKVHADPRFSTPRFSFCKSAL